MAPETCTITQMGFKTLPSTSLCLFSSLFYISTPWDAQTPGKRLKKIATLLARNLFRLLAGRSEAKVMTTSRKSLKGI